MRIMQILPRFGFGGAEIMCANLAIALKEMGEEVIVVSLYDFKSPIVTRMIDSGVEVVLLNKKLGFDLGIMHQLLKCMRNYSPDVVHTHLYACKYAHIISIFLGVKTRLHTIHSLANHSDGKLSIFINRLLFTFCNVIPIALSSVVQGTISELYNLNVRKIPIVCNGIPLNRCIPKSVCNKVVKNVVHVGRFVKPKNHEELIKGFVLFHKYNPQSTLYLYGEGELQDRCKNLVNSLNATGYIVFCGNSSNIYGVLNSMDIFILPSLWEGFPMTLLEAMGTGLPIIASKVGGITDMLKDESDAILINPDSNSILNALIRLNNDYDLRERLRKNAIKKSRLFSDKHMAVEYLKIYEGCKHNEC